MPNVENSNILITESFLCKLSSGFAQLGKIIYNKVFPSINSKTLIIKAKIPSIPLQFYGSENEKALWHQKEDKNFTIEVGTANFEVSLFLIFITSFLFLFILAMYYTNANKTC